MSVDLDHGMTDEEKAEIVAEAQAEEAFLETGPLPDGAERVGGVLAPFERLLKWWTVHTLDELPYAESFVTEAAVEQLSEALAEARELAGGTDGLAQRKDR